MNGFASIILNLSHNCKNQLALLKTITAPELSRFRFYRSFQCHDYVMFLSSMIIIEVQCLFSRLTEQRDSYHVSHHIYSGITCFYGFVTLHVEQKCEVDCRMMSCKNLCQSHLVSVTLCWYC